MGPFVFTGPDGEFFVPRTPWFEARWSKSFYKTNNLGFELFVRHNRLPRPSPNSCGQVQAADIGIMGGPARKLDEETGKMMAVPGCKIFVGGRIGEDANLSLEPYKSGIPLDDESLIPELVDILKTQFGAVDKKQRKRDKLKKMLNLS